jgi:hypothetical protein
VLAAALGAFAAVNVRVARGAPRAEVNLDRPLVVLTASAPLDPERLADALRAYLDEFAVEIRTAPAAPRGDLRAELAASDGLGASVRAWAVVRLADGAPGIAEIEIVDRVTAKSLVSDLPRPPRDEDLYRAVALKVQALLRASLAEPNARVAGSPVLGRLAATTAPPPEEHRLGLETSFAVVAFPGDRLVQQGLSVALTSRLWRQRLELALGVQALSAVEARSGPVSATLARVPLSLAARLVRRVERWEMSAGILGEAAVVSIDATSSTLPVRGGWSVAPALGGQAGARLRLGSRASLGLRLTALGVLVGQRFTAQGQPLASLSGLEIAGEAGLGVDLW